MRIVSIDFSLPRQSLDIYVSGCKGPHCKGCHNPSAWDFNYGKELNQKVIDEITEYINNFSTLIKNVMIFGGEPLDQPLDEVVMLLKFLETFNVPIWLFTRYLLDKVPEEVLDHVDYIKTGRYQEENLCEDNIHYGIKLASRNQVIFKIDQS